MWREALWLVADDVATVAEIDDALRLGAGLRWSFMGSFLTYRICRRRRRHAPLHGPVRPGPAVAVDEAHRRARAHRRAGREARRPVRRPGRRALHPRARAAARRLPGRRDPGAARPGLRRGRGPAGARAGALRRRGRRTPAADVDLSRPLRLHEATVAAGVGRLQRPRPREPLPADVRRCDRRAPAPDRDRRRLPRARGQLLHGRDAPLAPARGLGRRPAGGRPPRCSGATRSGCTSSTRCSLRRRRAGGDGRADDAARLGRRPAAPARRAPRCSSGCARSPPPRPRCPRPERAGRSIGMP